MKKLLVFIAFVSTLNITAQVVNDTIDVNYLEDQLYISLTYNLLNSKPTGISQNGFSGGFSIGFIKDIPINKERNFGFGVGAGYAFNANIHNLKINEINGSTSFSIAKNFDVNRITTHAIEFPFEVRFRNSTPIKYKFWRVYAGMKFSYLFTAKYKFKDASELVVIKSPSPINNFKYGLTISAGYEVWNIYIYYGLKPLFNNAFLESEKIKMKDVHVGLKLYIM